LQDPGNNRRRLADLEIDDLCKTTEKWIDNMDLTSILLFLAIGAVAGWLAGLLMKGGGFGILGNIVVGILGAVVGGFLFGVLGISAADGLIGSIITATAGAVVLLFIVGLVKKN
jgi:uncharacterized membrane protein YeaQ/YmgE (transglycosylase-associated protein family)